MNILRGKYYIFKNRIGGMISVRSTMVTPDRRKSVNLTSPDALKLWFYLFGPYYTGPKVALCMDSWRKRGGINSLPIKT